MGVDGELCLNSVIKFKQILKEGCCVRLSSATEAGRWREVGEGSNPVEAAGIDFQKWSDRSHRGKIFGVPQLYLPHSKDDREETKPSIKTNPPNLTA